MSDIYVERALFIVGSSNDGKSTQLRSAFQDHRLGHSGGIPKAPRLKEVYSLSNERWLYVRLTSPHENGEDFETMVEKFCNAVDRTKQKHQSARRWNLMAPLQLEASNRLRRPETVVKNFFSRFDPERVRVVLLNPNCNGDWQEDKVSKRLVSKLWKIPRTEVLSVNATHKTANGLIYSDFFDFT